MSQALYRKWRPRLWDQVIGQEHVVQTLQNAIRSARVGHAYLFAGPRGTGKTTSARLLAKAVNCLTENLSERPCDQCAHCLAVNDGRFLDLIEIDAASNTSVEDVRDLRDKINFAPSQGRFKVYIIDEVHMLSTAAFNALLKTLEEPPPHAIFILATTEVHKIPATVLSRCQRHEFRRIPLNLIVSHLKQLAEQENLDVSDEAMILIARQATGSMRDAISLLDQLSSSGSRITLDFAQTVLGTAASQMVVDLVDAIIQRNPAVGLECIHAALDSGSDPRQFARQVVDYIRNLLLVRLGNADQIEATTEQRAGMARQAKALEQEQILDALRSFNSAASEARSGWQPGLPLELALAEAVDWTPAQPTTASVASSTEKQNPQPQPAKTAPHNKAQSQELVQSSPQPSEPKSVEQPSSGSILKREPPSTPAANPPSNSDEPTKAMVMQNWAKVRAATKRQHSMTEGLLNSCRTIELRDGVLELGFASPLLKSKMEKDDNINIARAAIKQVLGWDLPIVCVDVSGKGGGTQTDADVDAEGMVNAALSLGGKIVQKE